MQQRMGGMHGMGGDPGPVATAPVLVAGRLVGSVELRFPAQAPSAASGSGTPWSARSPSGPC